MFEFETLWKFAANSALFGSWHTLRGILLGVTLEPWYFWFLSVLTYHESDIAQSMDSGGEWNYPVYMNDIPLAPINITDCHESSHWGDLRFMQQLHFRKTIIHVCRETESYDVWETKKEREFGEEYTDKEIYWVSDDDYIKGIIENEVEKRRVLEWDEWERVTWHDYNWPAIKAWEKLHEWNYFYRFDNCGICDSELFMEGYRCQHGMPVYEYVWYYTECGKYFIP